MKSPGSLVRLSELTCAWAVAATIDNKSTTHKMREDFILDVLFGIENRRENNWLGCFASPE
jgi:hypothetical protein